MTEPTERPVRLHSARDPHKEAHRYISSLPELRGSRVVVVTEPGESYLATALRDLHPEARIVAVRYGDTRFLDSDQLWDAVWRPGFGVSLATFLFSLLTEEILPQTAFVAWKPSDGYWPAESSAAWAEIAAVMRTQRSVLQTRVHFGPRWLSNSVRNAILSGSVVADEPIRVPCVITASGPTLARLFPFENRDSFFVIALSSSLTAVLARGITPDLCITTDGGYWANRHIANIPPNVPVAFPLEAALPSRVLGSNRLLVFDYGSPLERALFSLSGVRGTPAEQSGTVAGTAALYALSRSDREVFAAGLDLAPGSARNHCMPHAFDGIVESSSSRVFPISQNLYERASSAAALEIYARWFSSRTGDFAKRFFRINPAQSSLGGIREADRSLVERAARDSAAPNGKPAFDNGVQKAPRGLVSAWLTESTEAFKDRGRTRDLAEYIAHEALAGDANAVAPDDRAVLADLLKLVSFRDYLALLREGPETWVAPEGISRDLEALSGKARTLEAGRA